MGMFDYLRCEYPLPGDTPEWVKRQALEGGLQTKDTPRQYLERYTITADGCLIHHAVDYEMVLEHERPYWGKPEWDTGSLFRWAGSVRSVPIGDVGLEDFNGDLCFIASPESGEEFYEYIAHFVNGRLESIRAVEILQ